MEIKAVAYLSLEDIGATGRSADEIRDKLEISDPECNAKYTLISRSILLAAIHRMCYIDKIRESLARLPDGVYIDVAP